MADIDVVMSWLEGLAEPDWRLFHSDSEVQNIAKNALELLKEQQKQIEQMNFIYGFVYGGEVKSVKRLVRCKDCVWWMQDGYCEYNHHSQINKEWFCADGEWNK